MLSFSRGIYHATPCLSQTRPSAVPMISGTDFVRVRSTRSLSFGLGTVCALVLLLALAACKKEEKAAAPDIRPVRTVTVEPREGGETVSLTGEIQPRYQADIGFRVNGKILARQVDIGTQVKKGDLLARLDPQQYRQDFQVAKAEVAKAEADAARARQVQASENLGYTDLKADNDGVISAIGADPGQVVSAGQMVVKLAQPGEREAVFNVAEAAFKTPPRNPTVEVQLVSNPNIKT